MAIDPEKVEYLVGASSCLGPIAENRIEQRGEVIASRAQTFGLIDRPWLARLRS